MTVTAPLGPNGGVAVEGTTQREIARIAQAGGLAFAFASTFATGGTDVIVWLWKNASDSYDLVIDEIEVSSDAAGLLRVQASTGTPGGATAATGKPLNLGGPTDPQTQCFGGAAVTGTTDGNIFAYIRLAAAGRGIFQPHGGLVVPPNTQVEVHSAINGTVDVVGRAYYRKRG